MKIFYCLVLLFVCLTTRAQGSFELLGHYTFPTGTYCAGMVGYADSLGNEYALVCYNKGIAIIDITDAANPTLIDTVPCNYAPGVFNREIRTYKQYAYTVSEFGDGLTIINLSQVHNGIVTYNRVYPNNMSSSHTVFIDENGIAYINGIGTYPSKQLILDLNANPTNPPVIGQYTRSYVHDSFVRNDTMWAACILDGLVRVIDVRNKAAVNAPSSEIASWHTPSNYTHNVWLSDDNKYLFTTDERAPSNLTCYDVTNLANVVETDRIQLGDNMAIAHNTHYKDGYCYTAGYTYGVTMHNVSNKYNLIEEAHYDTSPFSGNAFRGAWEAWPYLPSGNILVSDIETGLWVLKAHYAQLSFVEGIITDSICDSNIYGAEVKILEGNSVESTDLLGAYNINSYHTGYVSLAISKTGYITRIIDSVLLIPGSTLQLNVALLPSIPKGRVTIVCKDKDTYFPISNAKLLFVNGEGQEYAPSTNYSGIFHSCDMSLDTFTVYAGKWGYHTDSAVVITGNENDTITILLGKGYYDDFLFDYGWSSTLSVSYNGFKRTIPVGTFINGNECNPANDLPNDSGLKCYVTGFSTVDPYQSDLDFADELLSPAMDLTTYADPYICYWRWYINGYVDVPNDPLNIYLSNGSYINVLIDSVAPGNEIPGWQYRCIRVKDLPLSIDNNMKLRIDARDMAPGNVTEAAIDGFRVVDSALTTIESYNVTGLDEISVYPNPFSNQLTISLKQSLSEPIDIHIYDMAGNKIMQEIIPTGSSHVAVSPNLAAGVYVLKVFNSIHNLTTRIIKLN